MFDEKLAKALKFTEEDLIANRDGYMTKPQRVTLRKSFSWWRAGLWLVGSSACLSISVWAQIQLFLNAAKQDITYPFSSPLLFSVYCLPFIAFIGIWVIFAYFGGRNARADLRKGEVAMVEGIVTIQRRNTSRPKLCVDNGWWFLIPYKASSTVVEGKYYTIYYAPHTMQILSAEPME
jgi:hypothetical protein